MNHKQNNSNERNLKESKNKASVAEMDDREIVDLYWARDERAIEKTAEKYEVFIYTIAYNIVHNRMDCEECVNDTYLGTWNSIPPARPNIFQLFLAKIARNISIDRYRELSAKKKIPSEMTVSLHELEDCLSETNSMEEEYEIKEIARILNDFLRELDDREELMFFCRYYYADSVVNIANMLGVSRNTVFRSLAKTRKELKERLQMEGYYHE